MAETNTRGRTDRETTGRAAPDSEVMLLHCPTGHLSAVVAGIACGLLPGGAAPPRALLRAYFARALPRRGPGRLNAVGEGEGARSRETTDQVLCLARGSAGSLAEAAMTEIARVAGHRIWVQPALRAAGARTGRGQSPTAPGEKPDPGLYAATLLARLLEAMFLRGVADEVMAALVRRRYGELTARAANLPGRSLRRRRTHSASSPSGGDVRVVYHCFGAAHSSVAAAAIHCGRLAPEGPVRLWDVLSVPGFDQRGGKDIGAAFYVDCDGNGSDVFVIGFNGVREMITRAVIGLLARLPEGGRHVVLAETLPLVSALAKIGGYTSRRLGLIRLGRPLAAAGIVLSIPALRRIVASTQAETERLWQELRTHRAAPAPSAGPEGRLEPVAGRGSDGA